jgi:hypothetical protein
MTGWPTDAETWDALRKNAEYRPPDASAAGWRESTGPDAHVVTFDDPEALVGGQWHFGPGLYGHEEADALAIVRCCLYLGIPVSDIVSGMWMLALVERLAELSGDKEPERVTA